MKILLTPLVLLSLMACSSMQESEQATKPLTYQNWIDNGNKTNMALMEKLIVTFPKFDFFIENPSHSDIPTCIDAQKFLSAIGKLPNKDETVKALDEIEIKPSNTPEQIKSCAASTLYMCINSLVSMRKLLVKSGIRDKSSLNEEIAETHFCTKRWQ